MNSHTKGKGHQQLVQKFQYFFKTLNIKTSADNQGQNQVISQQIIHSKQQTSLILPAASSSYQQQSLELHIENRDVVEAKIK